MKILSYRPALLLLLVAALAAGCGGGDIPTVSPTALTPAEIPTQAAVPTSVPLEPAGTLAWEVAIVQNEAVLPQESNTVTLARAPFTLRVTLPAPLAVKLNVAITDQNFQALQPGFTFTEDCLLALCTGMDGAEDRLNPDQALFVDPELTHYLYYQAPDDHRWSRTEVTEAGATFERDVAVLNTTPIEQSADPALYLLLFANAANEGQIDAGELIKLVLWFNPAQ